jgi:hypothetical protein
VQSFNISRIGTEFGIFRISGLWRFGSSLNTPKVEVTIIEIMGTDGWVLLNQSSDKVINLIKDLIPIIHAHLEAKNS